MDDSQQQVVFISFLFFSSSVTKYLSHCSSVLFCFLLAFFRYIQLRLHPDHAYRVIENLANDSDALCAMGVTDYSLLVGVKVVQYDVAELTAAAKATRTAAQQQQYHGLNSMYFVGTDGTGLTGREGSSLAMPSLTEGPRTLFDERDTLASIRPTTHTMYGGNTTILTEPNKAHGSSAPMNSYTDGVANTIGQEESTAVSFASARDADVRELTADDNRNNNSASEFPARAVLAPSSYYMGVIDILETWTWRKR